MATSAIVFLMVVANSFGATTPKSVVEKQNQAFEKYWGTKFVWKFDDLPTTGTVPNFRVPYSGHIYTDRSGGTSSALRKYDLAFHGGRPLAVGFEQWDTTAFKKPTPRKGPFGMSWGMKMETPNWHGHCNGWTAAAIRHGEPKQSVTKNGVTFTPSDVKGLLAELYTYSEIVDLGGENYGNVHPGTLHAVLANWLGRHSHPIAMEATPGREKWNYPIYSYASSAAKRSGGRQEPGHHRQQVGGGDEDHAAQVEGHADVVVKKTRVDTIIDSLQQGHVDRRVVFDIEIIDIFDQHDRIAGAGISQGTHDFTGHGSEESSRSAFDFGHIGDSAHRHPNKVFAHSFGDRFGDCRLTGTVSANQTKGGGRAKNKVIIRVKFFKVVKLIRSSQWLFKT